MPCDTFRAYPVQTAQQRKKQVDAELAALEKALKEKEVKIALDKKTGALAFVGWTQAKVDEYDSEGNVVKRKPVTDLCALRKLRASSAIFREALAKAEYQHGVKLNEKVMAAGVHSHDGGKTFGKD